MGYIVFSSAVESLGIVPCNAESALSEAKYSAA